MSGEYSAEQNVSEDYNGMGGCMRTDSNRVLVSGHQGVVEVIQRAQTVGSDLLVAVGESSEGSLRTNKPQLGAHVKSKWHLRRPCR